MEDGNAATESPMARELVDRAPTARQRHGPMTSSSPRPVTTTTVTTCYVTIAIARDWYKIAFLGCPDRVEPLHRPKKKTTVAPPPPPPSRRNILSYIDHAGKMLQ